MGMYIGGGNYIHAPHTGDVVRIASMSSRGDWIGFPTRRVAPNDPKRPNAPNTLHRTSRANPSGWEATIALPTRRAVSACRCHLPRLESRSILSDNRSALAAPVAAVYPRRHGGRGPDRPCPLHLVPRAGWLGCRLVDPCCVPYCRRPRARRRRSAALHPWPTLFGQEDARTLEEDVVNRRRAWYWRKKVRLALWIGGIITFIWVIRLFTEDPGDRSWVDAALTIPEGIGWLFSSGLGQVLILPLFFVFNFLILFGPLAFMGISQMRAYEPGDADWGVKLDDVRGQAEAKEEVRRVVNLWQSGEAFERSGGKRERGLLLLGARNGQDDALEGDRDELQRAVHVDARLGLRRNVHRDRRRHRAHPGRPSERLARKWGGQCIVFIDEIDAVGMRRRSLGGPGNGLSGSEPQSFHDFCFYGPHGALTPTAT